MAAPDALPRLAEQIHHEGLARAAAAGPGQGAGSRGPTGLAPAAGTGTVRLESREGKYPDNGP